MPSLVTLISPRIGLALAHRDVIYYILILPTPCMLSDLICDWLILGVASPLESA